ASQAEVDLIVNATRTLPDLERDLDRVLRAAQADMSDLDVAAVLDQTTTLRQLDRDLSRVIGTATADSDDVLVTAALNQRASIRNVLSDLDNLVNQVDTGGRVDPVLITAALNGPASLRQVRRDVDEVVALVQATAPDIDIDVDVDRNLTRNLLSAAGGLGRVTQNVTQLSAALGAAAPLLASVAGAMQNLLPATAVATQGILSVVLATATLKLGMMGVSDAVKDAFDPGTKPEDLEKSLKTLAPEARKFVRELISMKSEFKKLQLGVQNRLFKDFDEAVKGLGDEVLPRVGKALNQTATTFNKMGIGVAQAAVKLSRDGTLGKALDGATKGLQNLVKVPAQATTAFGQLAAAAAPAFDRVTKAVARAATKWSDKIDAAFKDGSLEKAIDRAVSAVAQLGRVFGNVFSGLGNIIRSVSVEGDGLFGTLEKVTQGFEDLTKNADVQAGLKALGETAALVSKTVLPLLAEAIKIVGRVLVSLQGPIQEVVTLLGAALGDALKALGPVLVTAGRAVGDLLRALSPFITLAGTLVSALLPVLNPLLSGMGDIFRAAAPFIQEVATVLSSLFLPVLQQLPDILAQIMPVLTTFFEETFPELKKQLELVAPVFADLGLQIADVAIALAPLIVQVLEFATVMSADLLPLITGAVIGTLGLLAGSLTGISVAIEDFVIPSLRIFVGFLNGDVFDASTYAGRAVRDFADAAKTKIRELVDSASERFGHYYNVAKDKFSDAKDSALDSISDMVSDAVDYLSDLPGRAANAVGDLGHVLYDAGASLISGLIDG
ncbi:hypothetical protein, partial [Streptomyces sp. 130]|uniref:hypothetical protein n=1 Tax=Streptomyces sp. 130 TaxID=2591006 RepID=UPI00163DC8FB